MLFGEQAISGRIFLYGQRILVNKLWSSHIHTSLAKIVTKKPLLVDVSEPSRILE